MKLKVFGHFEATEANDPRFEEACSAPTGGLDSGAPFEAALQTCANLLGAPVDWPHQDKALRGLQSALEILSDSVLLAKTTRPLAEIARQKITTNGQQQNIKQLLSRRKGKFRLYSLAVDIGSSDRELGPDALIAVKIFGLTCLRRLLEPYQPPSSSIAKVARVFHNDATTIGGQPSRELTRSFHFAKIQFERALIASPASAGIVGSDLSASASSSGNEAIKTFNNKFRRHFGHQGYFASTKKIHGLGGHGTLSKSALKEAGQRLISAVLSGDEPSMLVCLQILTNLSAELCLGLAILKKKEIADRGEPLAGVDLVEGRYYYRLEHLRHNEDQSNSQRALYIAAERFVSIALPLDLWQGLISLHSVHPNATTIGDLLNVVQHSPRSSIFDGQGLLVTPRKLQDSIPSLLLTDGHLRWPVALAFNAFQMVSRGRKSYGVCHQNNLDTVVRSAFRLLGWNTKGTAKSDDRFVGSNVTPTHRSVQMAANHLASRVNQVTDCDSETDALIFQLNRYAEWLAFILALTLALRARTKYALNWKALQSGMEVNINDKDVHLYAGPSNPIPIILANAIARWVSLLVRTERHLSTSNRSSDIELMNAMASVRTGISDVGLIFKIHSYGLLEPIGTSTWRDALPSNLKLVGNFSRHFWPHQLAERGLKQHHFDRMLRHQIESLHEHGGFNTRIGSQQREELRLALDSVLKEMGLIVPTITGISS